MNLTKEIRTLTILTEMLEVANSLNRKTIRELDKENSNIKLYSLKGIDKFGIFPWQNVSFKLPFPNIIIYILREVKKDLYINYENAVIDYEWNKVAYERKIRENHKLKGLN